MNRRSLLRALGLGAGAAIAPRELLVARDATSAGLNISGLGSNPDIYGMNPRESPSASKTRAIGKEQFAAAMKVPYLRELIIAEIRKNVSVHALDHDLVNKHSWSLAAKIHYQRERNLAEYVAGYESTEDGGYYKIKSIVAKWLGMGAENADG